MYKIFLLPFLLALMTSCSTTPPSNKIDDRDVMERAIQDASPFGSRVLETSKQMIIEKDIIVGGCWDFINAIYNKAGIVGKERTIVYKSKLRGPYVDADVIEAGDWLYFVNHSFNDIEHSAIFITWLDKDKKEALMVNYVGGNQKKPGTYKRFILDEVYNIIRGQ